MKHARWFRAIGLANITLMAVVCIGVLPAPRLCAQDSITIKDPQEFNAYLLANTQTDPKTKVGQLEGFLEAYPQSVVKSAILDNLIDTYKGLGDADKTLSAASRLLQVDPGNMKAIFISVFIKKGQCAKTSDAQTCDEAAELASEGLATPKPASISDGDWRKQTSATFPVFHSAIALDHILSKGDVKAGISEYRTELMIYPPDQTQSGPGLWDTLQLAEAYTKPGGEDLVQAVWFYARAWNFAPASLKTPIETKMKYYYTNYHGNLDGLDAVKAQAAAAVFPPGTQENEPAALQAASPNPIPAQRQYEDLAPPPPPPAPAPTISMGQTKDQVTGAFGEPQRKAVAGPKEIFFYTELKMKVTFTGGKVSSIE